MKYIGFLEQDPALADVTKRTRRRHLEEVCREPLKEGRDVQMGDVPVTRFGPAHAQVLVDRMMKTPEAANVRRKSLVAMFRWAIKRGLARDNPAALSDGIKTYSEGHVPWTDADLEKFQATHALGSKAHLAMALLLYTDQRRGDVVRFGRQHLKDGALEFVQQKNEKRMHKRMRIPILQPLQVALDLVPKDQLTFLVTEYGRPFTAAGFGNWFRAKCDEAGLQGLSAHGLRKTLLNQGTDAGLTQYELMAIAGHESPQQTAKYVRKRDRDALAASGMKKLASKRAMNKSVPPKFGA